MKIKLLLASLLLFGIASAQAPKIKHIYKDKITYDASGVEIKQEPQYFEARSATGKLEAFKQYQHGKDLHKMEYFYDKNDSLKKSIITNQNGSIDSTVAVRKNNSDTVISLLYHNGKLIAEHYMIYLKNGKIIYKLKNDYSEPSEEKIFGETEFDSFGNIIIYKAALFTSFSKYSDDGKLKLEEESFSFQRMESYKKIYLYNKEGSLYKELTLTNGYPSSKSATSEMIYSDTAITTYSYDKEKNLQAIYVYGKGKKLTAQTIYMYDSDNRIIKEQPCNGLGECKELITYTYDKHGNLLEEIHWPTDKSGRVDWKYVYTYDFY